MLTEVEELIIHFIVICDEEYYMAASKSVTYGKGMIAAVNYFLKVRGGNIVMYIQKTNKSHGH